MLNLALLWVAIDAAIFMALRRTFTWTTPMLWFSIMGVVATWLLLFGSRVAGGKK
jgi:hypothetical protein